MLQTVPPETHNFKPGDFLVYAGHGLCVFRGYKEVEFEGKSQKFSDVRKISNLQTSISVPVYKFNDPEVISVPPTLDIINQIFETLAAQRIELKGYNHHKEKAVKELLKSSDPVTVAKGLHLILSSKRGNKLTENKKILELPGEIKRSYSEMTWLDEALKILVPLITYRCGLSNDKATDYIFRAVLTPSFLPKIILEDKTNGETGLTREEFFDVFGETRTEAQTSQETLEIVAKVVTLPLKRQHSTPATTSAQLRLLQAIDTTKNKIPSDKVTQQRAPKKSIPPRRSATLGQQNRKTGPRSPIIPQSKALFDQLINEIPSGPYAKVVLRLAARTFDKKEEFFAAAKLWLVKKEHRMTHAEIHEKLQLSQAAYDEWVFDVKDKLEQTAKLEGNKSLAKVKLHLNDKKSTRLRTSSKYLRKTKVLEHNKTAHSRLVEQLPKTQTTRSIFNLAAAHLDDPQKFEAASKLWLVRREHRLTHAQIQEHFGISAANYPQWVKSISDSLTRAAETKSNKSLDKIRLHLKDKTPSERKAKPDNSRKSRVLEHNQTTYNNLSEKLPTTPTTKVIFNLAAAHLNDPQKFEAAAKLWLVKRGHRSTHTQIQEELGLSQEQYTQWIKNVASDIKTTAHEKRIKSIDKINFTFEDAVKKLRALPEKQTITADDDSVFSLEIPIKELRNTRGVDLNFKIDPKRGVLILTGKTKQRPEIQNTPKSVLG